MTALALALLLQAAPSPAPAPCDPAIGACLASESWLVTLRSWTPGGAAPRDLVGGRWQAEIRRKGWRWAVRADATGVPGEYRADQWETVRAAELTLASAYDLAHLPGGVTVGPASAIGAAVALEHGPDGARPKTPKSLTAGLGLRAAWPNGWAYLVVGQHQSLRGVAAIWSWQVALSDHVATIGTAACGSRDWLATTGVAVRVSGGKP